MLIFKSLYVAANLRHSLLAYYVYIVIGDIFPNVMNTNLYMLFITF